MTQYYKTVNINTASPETSDTSILIIYTGGTIGMDYDYETGSLIPFDFEKIMEKVPELKRFNFELTVLSFEHLIDSSDIKTRHWLNLAKIIEDFYDEYDGFVILHGTDTMAYSASALSFLTENLGKPIIFTGAQLPIGASRTDARENLISALEIASTQEEDGRPLVPEVCIYFDHYLLRGNRSKKVQSMNFTAFESHNLPPLAVAGIHIDFNHGLLRPDPEEPVHIYRELNENVIILKLFPGINQAYLESILSIPNLKGVVMETYGSGNAPTAPWFLNCLKRALDKGIYIYNVSQCSGGHVLQGRYATSKHLSDIGVISGGDITSEAAITKMMFVLANEKREEKIRCLLTNSIRGEIS
ncbi:asparaginase [Rapidithrix thailandica]|uniref:asparaginase n=1 Tax=Rapidithrix thailandica TaxID=413964 RepID=A0AAW9SEG1_9BACT